MNQINIEKLYDVLKYEKVHILIEIFKSRLIDTYKCFLQKKDIDNKTKKGIYFFIKDFKIKYIGSTGSDLKSRIAKHTKYKNEVILFFEMEKFKGVKIRRLEKALILLYEPSANDLSYLDGRNKR